MNLLILIDWLWNSRLQLIINFIISIIITNIIIVIIVTVIVTAITTIYNNYFLQILLLYNHQYCE